MLIFIVVAFLALIVFKWESDLSADHRFSKYLNVPIIVASRAQLVEIIESVHSENGKRYVLYIAPESPYEESELYNEKSMRTIKVFSVGDTIHFHHAKSRYSFHVGTNHFFIGRDTLPDGSVVDFTYQFNLDIDPAVWETLEEFRERRTRERAEESK
jgi:hypothetical protein